jgi:HAD superfamily hydrolase (TIGR01509 family)
MADYDAVLFDFGDTLFHRTGGPPRLVELAAEHGRSITADAAQALWDQVQLASRTPEAMAKGRDLSRDAHDREWLALYAAFDEHCPGVGAALYDHEMAPGGWVPFSDTKPTLDALRHAGVKVGVISNAGWDVRIQLMAAGLHELVDVYALSYEIGVIKPDPKIFLRPCEELGVEPERSLMVGDTPIPDGGALAVGMPVYLLPLAPPGGPRGLDGVLRLAGVDAATTVPEP